VKIEIVVALIAGVFSLLAAGISFWTSVQNDKNSKDIAELQIKEKDRETAEQRQKEMSYYSEPLARAAYDLNNRIYNILRQNLIGVYLVNGNEREQSYVVDSTVFDIAQYLCWTEIVRRDIQYIDTGVSENTRQFQLVQIRITRAFATDGIRSPVFRLFAVEQQAVGEALRQINVKQKWECMGYGTFLKTFPRGADKYIDGLRDDVEKLRAGTEVAAERLQRIKDRLAELLDLLDPEAIRFPEYRVPKSKR
jgi:hypothetical protein